jgi:hypothetical protein
MIIFALAAILAIGQKPQIMQTNPYSTPSPTAEGFGGSYSQQAVAAGVMDQLARTKPWARLISVLILIGSLFMVGIGLVMGLGGGAAMIAGNQAMGGAEVGIGLGMMFLYILIAVLYIYPGIKLWRYATRIGILLQSGQVPDLEAALNEQRAFWKFVGILAIAVMALYLVILVVAIVGTVAAAALN